MEQYYFLAHNDFLQENDEYFNQHPQQPFWVEIEKKDFGKKASKYHLVRRKIQALESFEIELKRFKRNLSRIQEVAEKIREEHRGKETSKYNYFGGYDLGYRDGEIKVLEDIIDLLEKKM